MKRQVAGVAAVLLTVTLLPLTGFTAPAQAAPTGQGFTVTPSDLAYILEQIKIAEAHVGQHHDPRPDPVLPALLGTGPDQIPSPLLSFGLRTVDGRATTCSPARRSSAPPTRRSRA